MSPTSMPRCSTVSAWIPASSRSRAANVSTSITAKPSPRSWFEASLSNWNRKALVSTSNHLQAVATFQPLHNEMAASHVLEMIDEHHVDNASGRGAHDRNRLGRDLLRNN